MLIVMLWTFGSFSQQQLTAKKEQKTSERLTKEAQRDLNKEKFSTAEANYRKAIALDPNNQPAKYNLGNAYYNNKKNDEALHRYKQAVKNAVSKEDKHKALHNLGNTFMNSKMYREAVEAYKDALRNNPRDEETRYNLALAKDLLDKNPPPPEDDNQDDQNDDQNQEQDNNQNQDENDDSDDDNKEDKDKGDDKQDKEEGDDETNKGKPEEDDNQEQPQQSQRQPGQLSPEQIQSLLDAMENEEKRVQDKMNLEKQKGSKVKSDKNW